MRINNSPYIKSSLGYSYFYKLNGEEIRSFGHVEGGLRSLSGYLYKLEDCKVLYPEYMKKFNQQLTAAIS